MAEPIIMRLMDGLLVATLLWLAWRALASDDLFKGIVLYIVFGLVLSLVWLRLLAPDVALAEAAIGAGLTGALFLSAYAKRQAEPTDSNTSNATSKHRTEK
jgi:energy-converting hydrogenase B subunit D